MKNAFRYDPRYNCLHRWKVNSVEPAIQNLYVKALNYILLREHSLTGLSRLINKLDRAYWKYCCLRIYTSSKNASSLYEPLVNKIALIMKFQDEIAVAIAHLRSLSIATVEHIVNWKRACYMLNPSCPEVSLYWHDQNYLIKMKTDTCPIMEAHVMRLWL